MYPSLFLSCLFFFLVLLLLSGTAFVCECACFFLPLLAAFRSSHCFHHHFPFHLSHPMSFFPLFLSFHWPSFLFFFFVFSSGGAEAALTHPHNYVRRIHQRLVGRARIRRGRG
ncbi:hypothetical protein TRSC58_07435 [Trypanosoma rangeli SC58]|uniref:Uncharacterized protein n=1 Tax=Trypanosoma rangeli SC58 TaxID=429131 RepID=A0A061ISU4_TRYRA|nr:hypothetical protein TRSC58_07435 [Trypanosoma rangeli SC58]